MGHPMGTFRLMDLTGLDLAYTIRTERYKASGDPKDKPPKILEESSRRVSMGGKRARDFIPIRVHLARKGFRGEGLCAAPLLLWGIALLVARRVLVAVSHRTKFI